LRVHAVDAQNNELLIAVPFSVLAGKQKTRPNPHQHEETQAPDS